MARMRRVGLAHSPALVLIGFMALSFAKMHVQRRRPYERYRRERWRFVFWRQEDARTSYQPWGAREGFLHPLEDIPGYWVRQIGPRFQQGCYSRCFTRGQFSRFTKVR